MKCFHLDQTEVILDKNTVWSWKLLNNFVKYHTEWITTNTIFPDKIQTYWLAISEENGQQLQQILLEKTYVPSLTT